MFSSVQIAFSEYWGFLTTVLNKIGSLFCRGDLLVEEILWDMVLFRPEAKMLL